MGVSQYFQGYAESDEPSGTEPLVADPGLAVLPFDYLGGRGLEMLCHRLLSVERSQDHVVLTQGTGERGRDVIVFRGGQVHTIVQCKNYRDRLARRQVREELVKLAMHAYLEPDILPSVVHYQLWVPGGLSEEAEAFFATWPEPWRSDEIVPDIERAIQRYAAFSDLKVANVLGFLLDRLRDGVRATRIAAVDLTPRVRKRVEVYRQFFGGAVVMDSGDVVLGISPGLVARLRRAEYEDLVRPILTATSQLTHVLMKACGRLHAEHAEEFRRQAMPCHPALPVVVGKLLLHSMLARLANVSMANLSERPFQDYGRLTVDERLDRNARETFASLTRCRDGYNPSKHLAGTDEELRYRIAVRGLRGAKSPEDFVEALAHDVDRHRALVQATFDSWMAQVPRQLMVLCDSVSIFEDASLLKRMLETTNQLAKLRGSEIVPE